MTPTISAVKEVTCSVNDSKFKNWATPVTEIGLCRSQETFIKETLGGGVIIFQ